MKNVLSIAGFDGSGGAGLQADMKTISMLGCYATQVLTALPIQNTQGVSNCYAIPLMAIEEQLHSLFADIRPNAIKIGMLFNTAIIDIVAGFLMRYAQDIPIVLDPVMVATSGDVLLQSDAMQCLIEKLFPLCDLITPNKSECMRLICCNDQSLSQLQLGELLSQLIPCAVLVKGGHEDGPNAIDMLFQKNKQPIQLVSKRVDTKHTHGTGCTLSSAIAVYLAQEKTLAQACFLAKKYLTQALEAGKHGLIGKGCGPVHHCYALKEGGVHVI